MKALIWKGIHKLELAEIPEPVCVPGWLKIRVQAVGICATEIAMIDGLFCCAEPPHILGHEICGDIVELGEGCDASLLHRRVVVETYVGCGECEFCRTGRKHLCKAGEIGYPPYNGGYEQYVTVPQSCVRMIPDNVSYDEGAIMEAVACPYGAMSSTQPQPEETVLIQGAGIAGLSFLQSARAFGVKRVFCTVRNDTKADLVKRYGGIPIDARVGDPERQIMALTNGLGADICVDAVGSAETVKQSVKCVKSGGRVLLYGLPEEGEQIPFPVTECILRQIRITGYTGNEKCWDPLISLVSEGKISIKELVSASYPLSEFDRAFALLHSHRSDVIKVVLHPWEE